MGAIDSMKSEDWDAAEDPRVQGWIGRLMADRLPTPPSEPKSVADEEFEAAAAEAEAVTAAAMSAPASAGTHVGGGALRFANGSTFTFPPGSLTITQPPEETPMAPPSALLMGEPTPSITPMTRKSASTGAHGLYATARKVTPDDTVEIRGFLTATFFGLSTAGGDGKASRWVITECDSPGSAMNLFEDNFAGLTVSVVVCELSAADVDRIRRGVMPSLIYPAADVLAEARTKPESTHTDPF